MKFSHFNVFTESKHKGGIYMDFHNLVACYETGEPKPYHVDMLVIKVFTNLDKAIESLKQMNNAVSVFNIG